MRLTRLGVDRDLPTVVVLGAGASAGARLSVPAPLGHVFVDGDFFDQLQYFAANADEKEFRDDARDFLKYLATQYGHGRHGLEEIFAELDVTSQFTATTDVIRRGPRSKVYENRVSQLTRLIVRCLVLSIGASPDQLPACDRHQALARHLGVGDSVISFNYDLLIDRAMSKGLGAKFDPYKSYGFTPATVAPNWVPEARRGAPFKRHTQLLKPHGSLHWQRSNGTHEIGASETSIPVGQVALIPPQYLKRFEQEPFAAVWRAARRELRAARALVIAGYSLPSSDIFTAAALRLEVTDLELICIANPDTSARDRILDVLRSALRPETAVVFFDTFAQLAERLGAPSDAEYAADRQDFSWLKDEIDERIFDLVPDAYERRTQELESGRGK